MNDTLYIDSILDSVKHAMPIDLEETSFDSELIMFTNSSLSYLTDLGLGPKEGFKIVDNISTWTDFLGESNLFELVQEYVFLDVKLVFDPPTSSYILTAYKEKLEESKWRITNKLET